MAVPAVLLVLAACLGGLRIGTERLRVVDAAAQAARLAARGDAPGPAADAVGGRLESVRAQDETVCATVSVDVPVLGAPIPLTATGCALAGMRP